MPLQRFDPSARLTRARRHGTFLARELVFFDPDRVESSNPSVPPPNDLGGRDGTTAVAIDLPRFGTALQALQRPWGRDEPAGQKRHGRQARAIEGERLGCRDDENGS